MKMMITDKKFSTSNERRRLNSRGPPRLPVDCPLPLPLNDWLTRFYLLQQPKRNMAPWNNNHLCYQFFQSIAWLDGWMDGANTGSWFAPIHPSSSSVRVLRCREFLPRDKKHEIPPRIEPKLGCLFNKTTLSICSWKKKKTILTTTSIHYRHSLRW